MLQNSFKAHKDILYYIALECVCVCVCLCEALLLQNYWSDLAENFRKVSPISRDGFRQKSRGVPCPRTGGGAKMGRGKN